MDTTILNRKGVRKVDDIPKEVLDLLNTGKIETVNLTEWLAIDHLTLIKANFPEVGISKENTEFIVQQIKALKNPTAMNVIKLVGASLYQTLSAEGNLASVLIELSSHPSDSIRCYAPFLIALNQTLSLEEKLQESEQLIADKHFGVREVVWIALRPEIDQNLESAIPFLKRWTNNEDENVRRFTTEATRPRGVWCKHIEKLKETPEIALPILDPLKADPSKYVQDSVGNWLNDASKTKPDFVLELCEKWQKESPTKHTERIIKKARRTIDKANG